MTNLLDEVEHVVSSVQPALRREQDNVVVLPETVRETLQDEDCLDAGHFAAQTWHLAGMRSRPRSGLLSEPASSDAELCGQEMPQLDAVVILKMWWPRWQTAATFACGVATVPRCCSPAKIESARQRRVP